MDKYVAQENSSFVLHLGDNMYPDGVDSVDDSQWRESFLNIYGGGSSGEVPWYAIHGNHDYYKAASPQAEIDYTTKGDSNGLWNFPDFRTANLSTCAVVKR